MSIWTHGNLSILNFLLSAKQRSCDFDKNVKFTHLQLKNETNNSNCSMKNRIGAADEIDFCSANEEN